MKILRAEHLGMCFGVRDAIALALKESMEKPLTIIGDLVHNETVLRELRARGIRIAQTASAASTPDVMITAHGASQKAIRAARDQGLSVTEATCPLVHLAHRAVSRLVEQGYFPVIIGKRDHVEVRGMTEDLHEFEVILQEADVLGLRERPKFGVVAQTTQPIERVRELAGLIRKRFPASEVRLVDTVCQPTKQRQHAAVEVAQHSDVVIVIGGANSNNTRELVETCRKYCLKVYHVQTAADLDPAWTEGAETIGITAGTSTPDVLIDGVEQELVRVATGRMSIGAKL